MKEKVDFEKEIVKIVDISPWKKNIREHPAVKHCNNQFKKYSQDFIYIANTLLERSEDDKIVDLQGLPFI